MEGLPARAALLLSRHRRFGHERLSDQDGAGAEQQEQHQPLEGTRRDRAIEARADPGAGERGRQGEQGDPQDGRRDLAANAMPALASASTMRLNG